MQLLLNVNDNVSVACVALGGFPLTKSTKIEIDTGRKAWMTILKWQLIKGKWRLIVSSMIFYQIESLSSVFMTASSFCEKHWFTQHWITGEQGGSKGPDTLTLTWPLVSAASPLLQFLGRIVFPDQGRGKFRRNSFLEWEALTGLKAGSQCQSWKWENRKRVWSLRRII